MANLWWRHHYINDAARQQAIIGKEVIPTLEPLNYIVTNTGGVLRPVTPFTNTV